MKNSVTVSRKKDFKRKIYYLGALLLLFRILSYIPTPFINASAVKELSKNEILGVMSIFTGGALAKFRLLAFGVNSYITASILVQLATNTIESLYRLSKTPGGQERIKKIQMVLGIIISFLSSISVTYVFNSKYHILVSNSVWVLIAVAIFHCIGTAIAIKIGETIDDRSFGNGMSLLIFVNIISSVPHLIASYGNTIKEGHALYVEIGVFVLLFVFIAIIIAETSEKLIPLINTKALARGGKRVNSFFAIKLNISGVMPVIFAMTILQALSFLTLLENKKVSSFIEKYLNYSSYNFIIITSILIFLFAYFYKDLIFNEIEIAEDMQTRAIVIKGLNPGRDTVKYLKSVSKRMTLVGAIYLTLVATIPTFIFKKIGFNMIGTTSLMIMVNVSIDFVTTYLNEKNLLKLESIERYSNKKERE